MLHAARVSDGRYWRSKGQELDLSGIVCLVGHPAKEIKQTFNQFSPSPAFGFPQLNTSLTVNYRAIAELAHSVHVCHTHNWSLPCSRVNLWNTSSSECSLTLLFRLAFFKDHSLLSWAGASYSSRQDIRVLQHSWVAPALLHRRIQQGPSLHLVRW